MEDKTIDVLASHINIQQPLSLELQREYYDVIQTFWIGVSIKDDILIKLLKRFDEISDRRLVCASHPYDVRGPELILHDSISYITLTSGTPILKFYLPKKKYNK